MQFVSSNKNTTRNYGIDFLRIIAMLGIVMIHTLNHGQIVSNSTLGTANYYVSTFLMTAVWCSVDIFALISGFVLYQSKSTFPSMISGFIRLWLEVLFYSVGISLLFYWFLPNSINKYELLKSFAPLTTKAYWYFSAYFFVILFAPLLNKLIESSSIKKLCILAVLGICILYMSHLIRGIFGSVLLVYLYFIGGILSKYKSEIKLANRWYIITILGLFIFTWLWGIYWEPINTFISGLWLRNDSPTIILISICFVNIFSRFKPSHTLFLSLITPSVFSVYLINDNWLIRKYFISNHFTWLNMQPWYILLIYVISFAIVFFIGAILIDMIRRKINKYIGVDDFIKKCFRREQ